MSYVRTSPKQIGPDIGERLSRRPEEHHLPQIGPEGNVNRPGAYLGFQ